MVLWDWPLAFRGRAERQQTFLGSPPLAFPFTGYIIHSANRHSCLVENFAFLIRSNNSFLFFFHSTFFHNFFFLSFNSSLLSCCLTSQLISPRPVHHLPDGWVGGSFPRGVLGSWGLLCSVLQRTADSGGKELGLFEPCSAELCCVVLYTFLSPTLHFLLVGSQDQSTSQKGKVKVILVGTGWTKQARQVGKVSFLVHVKGKAQSPLLVRYTVWASPVSFLFLRVPPCVSL